MTNSPAPTQTPAINLPTPVAGTVRALLSSESVKRQFHEVMAERAPQFIASLATVVYGSTQLKTCEPQSVIAAALKAASLDLPIEPSLGFAAIVPYGSQASFQMQWKGYIQLALRTNQYANIHVTEVYEGMVKGVDPFTGKVIKGEKTGDKVTGYYGYFKLINGFEKEIYMSVEEVQAHGQRYSKTYHKAGSTWKTDLDAMGRKTVLKRLITRYGILSVDMQKAIQAEVPPEESEPVGTNGNGQPDVDYTDPAQAAAEIEREQAQRARDKAALYPEE